MRNYIFRGKRVYGDGWAYGSLVKRGDYCCILEDEDALNPSDDYPWMDAETGVIDGNLTPVRTDTVGQYTELFDRNGKRIYEGDILRYDDGNEYDENEKAVVVWMDSGFWLEYHNGQTEPWYEQDWCHGNVYFEVIGNIHDNTELLEVLE